MIRKSIHLAAAVALTLGLAGCQSTGGDSGGSHGSGGNPGPVATTSHAGGPTASARGNAAVGGVTGGGVGSNQGEACTADMGFSNFDLDHPSATLGGAAKVICIDPPDFITHTLYLEYQSAGDNTDSWTTEGSGSFQTQFSYNPEAGFIVRAGCRVGTWRLRYKAIGVDAAKMPIDINYTSPKLTVFVPRCP